MRVLGAIIGGGRSRRFGSDKAAVIVDGRPLIEHVHAALAPQVSGVILCGRRWKDWSHIPDLPEHDLGPLGGLNAALAHGCVHGFTHVLSVPVDTIPLPPDLLSRLSPAPAALIGQYLIGLWPVALQDSLSDYLAQGGRAVRPWIDAAGGRLVDEDGWRFANINRPDDLPSLG